MTDLETRVREALLDGPDRYSADDLLDRIRRDVRRRRARRTTGIAVVAALILAAAVAAPVLHHRSTPAPSDRLPHGYLVGLTDVSVSSSGTRFKTVVNDGCTPLCTEVLSQTGPGAWTRIGEVPAELTRLAMSPNGRDGWAWGVHVWSTHDGARTWTRVTALPDADGAPGGGVIAGPDVAWAIVPGTDGSEIWRSPVDADMWTKVQVPPTDGEPTLLGVLSDSRVLLGSQGFGGFHPPKVVVGDGTSWHRYTLPCYRVPELFGGDPSTRGKVCGTFQLPWGLGNPGGMAHRGHRLNGSQVEIGMTAEAGQPVGAVLKLYVHDDHAVVYGPEGADPARLDLGRDQISTFAIAGSQAVLSTDHGRVFTSTDGGYTWTRDD